MARGQIVHSYFGTGLIGQGVLQARPNDTIGIAVARATISETARSVLGLPRAETTLEVTYQYKVRDMFSIQPDLQYVHHPAGIAHADDALAVGLRLVLTAGYPRKPPATDSSDPTVPPEGPQPEDAAAK